jgi:hypothetical protein
MALPTPLPRLTALAPLFALALAGAACSLGPSEEEPDFQYGAEEMRSTVAGDWAGDFAPMGGAATTFTLRLEHAPPGTAPACGNRQLGVGWQCSDSSSLAVKGTFTTADGAYRDAPVEGAFTVDGLTFGSGGYLSLGLGDDTALDADWYGGKFRDGTIWKAQAQGGTFTLRR